jgi:hypothetical protein
MIGEMKKNKAKEEKIFMTPDEEYDLINRKIDYQQRRIEQNMKLQSEYMATHGYQNDQ